jgi:hypothetical protein
LKNPFKRRLKVFVVKIEQKKIKRKAKKKDAFCRHRQEVCDFSVFNEIKRTVFSRFKRKTDKQGKNEIGRMR